MGAQHVGAMGQHHTLRTTGAAAREEQHVRVGLAQRGFGDGRVVVGGTEPRGADCVDAGSGRDARRVADPVVVRGEQRGPGGHEHVGGLVGVEHRADGREHRAQLRHRDEHRKGVETGRAPHHDAVAVADPPCPQRVRHLVGAAVEFAVGDDAVTEGRGRAIARGPGRVREQVTDEHLRAASALPHGAVPYSIPGTPFSP